MHWCTEIGLALNVISVPEESTDDRELHVPLRASLTMPEAKQSIAL